MSTEVEVIHMSVAEGIGELTRRKQRDVIAVARALSKAGRFSIYDACANEDIARTMKKLARSGWFVFDKTADYPWTNVTLTDAGREVLEVA